MKVPLKVPPLRPGTVGGPVLLVKVPEKVPRLKNTPGPGSGVPGSGVKVKPSWKLPNAEKGTGGSGLGLGAGLGTGLVPGSGGPPPGGSGGGTAQQSWPC